MGLSVNRLHFGLKGTEDDADSQQGPCTQTPCFWESDSKGILPLEFQLVYPPKHSLEIARREICRLPQFSVFRNENGHFHATGCLIVHDDAKDLLLRNQGTLTLSHTGTMAGPRLIAVIRPPAAARAWSVLRRPIHTHPEQASFERGSQIVRSSITTRKQRSDTRRTASLFSRGEGGDGGTYSLLVLVV